MPSPQTKCTHCGTPFSPRAEDEQFCCHGCAYAYELIRSSGLTRYYDLKRPTAPVRNTPFQQRDFADLAAWQGEREAAARAAGQPLAEGTLALSGVSCVGCVWLVEKVFEEQAGAVEIVVTVQRGEAKLRWRPGLFSIEDTAGRLQQFGYLLGRAVEGQAGRRHDEASTLARKLGLCGLFALNAMLFSLPRYLGMEEGAPLAGLFELAALGFATASLAVGGLFFVWRAAQSLRRGLLHIDLPIALGIVAAYAGSFAGWWLQRPELMYFDFVAVFIFLMLVGRWTQEVTLRRNQARLARQGLGPPREVLALLPDGSEIPLPREQLGPGQRMRLPPGAFVPVAARNGETTASVSLEWITGESEPRAVAPGEPLPAGTTNAGNTPIEVIASETWAESLLARLLETRTYDTRDPAMEAILRHYIAVVLVIATIGGVAWWLTAGFVPALQVFISILVVSCPCALGVAAPLASELGLSKMQNAGVFVKSAGLWRRLGEITTLVFDKTGTLTLENPRLINTEVLKDLTNEARDALRELVRDSLHPISRALRATVEAASSRFANTSDKRLEAASTVTETPGYGLTADINGATWTLGRPGWTGPAAATPISAVADAQSVITAQERVIADPETATKGTVTATSRAESVIPATVKASQDAVSADPRTVNNSPRAVTLDQPTVTPTQATEAHEQHQLSTKNQALTNFTPSTELRRDGQLVADFAFEDDVRDDARAQCEAWRGAGLRLAILSGDRPSKVAAMAEALGFDPADARGGLSPKEKAAWITREAPGRALMLGDGLNDSLAFDAAHVRGTPVVDRGLLEPKADFFFLDRGLTGIQTLLRTAQRYRTTVRQMFTFAAAYNLATVTLCLAGMMNPLLAAILMPASSLVTIGIAAAGMYR